MNPKAKEHELLLQLIGSLTLADNLGDVADAIKAALKHIGYEVQQTDAERQFADLQAQLARDGITTLSGTDLTPDDE